MDLNDSSYFEVNLNEFNGPLNVLLDLAKAQKVDLEKISITKLADQFHSFITEKKNINLEIASEYLLMATWLTYLKSKLLLPESEEEEFKVLEVAEKLKLQLKKLELIRLLSDQMLKRKRLGRDVFLRGGKATIPKLPVFTTEDGIRTLKQFIGKISDWKNLNDFVPENFKSQKKMIKTGNAGIFAASLELAKEGNISIKQDNLFDEIFIKER